METKPSITEEKLRKKFDTITAGLNDVQQEGERIIGSSDEKVPFGEFQPASPNTAVVHGLGDLASVRTVSSTLPGDEKGLPPPDPKPKPPQPGGINSLN